LFINASLFYFYRNTIAYTFMYFERDVKEKMQAVIDEYQEYLSVPATLNEIGDALLD